MDTAIPMSKVAGRFWLKGRYFASQDRNYWPGNSLGDGLLTAIPLFTGRYERPFIYYV